MSELVRLTRRLNIIAAWLLSGAWPVGENTRENAAADIRLAVSRLRAQPSAEPHDYGKAEYRRCNVCGKCLCMQCRGTSQGCDCPRSARPRAAGRAEPFKCGQENCPQFVDGCGDLADAYARIAALRSELAQATARAGQDAKDAARYRWLRFHADRVSLLEGLPGTCTAMEAADFDAIIDAALASGTGAV